MSDKTYGEIIGGAIFSAIKPIYKEGERIRRNAKRNTNRLLSAPSGYWFQKDVVFGVLPRAIENAGTPTSARDLYYAVRPLCYRHPGWPKDKELAYQHFSQNLLTEWQEKHGPIPGLWRDPRGHLHEPHTGKVLSLGTKEVAAYEFPPYVFDKALYVEKEGEWPKLQEARLAERYDMAVVSGKGYPVEAARAFFERAEKGDYQLFVFHDGDLDGYNIARVMREETRRMPDYSVDVVDIGLTVEDALDMGLESEPFARKGDISDSLYLSLSDTAREYLYNPEYDYEGKLIVRGDRFELNAILPASRRVEYIEGKLEENGVRGKVIPPEDELSDLADEMYREKHDKWVDEAAARLFLDEAKEELAERFKSEFNLEQAGSYIEECFEVDRTLSWRDALKGKLDTIQEDRTEALEDALRERIGEALDGGES